MDHHSISKVTRWLLRVLWPVERFINRFRRETLCLSDDASLYYVVGRAGPHGWWMAVARYPLGRVPPWTSLWEEKFCLKVEIVKGDGSAPYVRLAYPFTFFNIPSRDHRERRVPANDDLVLDYRALMEREKRRISG